MRKDALGLWWEDLPPARSENQPQEKRQPPEPTWLAPDYLPGLEQARAFRVHVMNDDEIMAAALRREALLFDIEVYKNYFLAAFASLTTGHVCYFDCTNERPLDVNRLGWILSSFKIVGFNSNDFDLPITSMALNGKNCGQLKAATNMIIYGNARASDVLKQFKTKALKCDHIDLIEVAPLHGSLKTYGGRLHVPRMQDLPFHPEAVLNEDQMQITKWYCINDLTQTAFLHEALKEQLLLRENMGKRYGMDLRSKSDAQMAEAILTEEIAKMTGQRPKRPEIPPGTVYHYRKPEFIQYHTPLMNWALDKVVNAQFIVNEKGRIDMPPELDELELKIAGSVYRMGIGGLHSSEKTVSHHSDSNYLISDRDVVSYYPQIILNLGLFPPHLGRAFLIIFSQIVDQRVSAKKAGNKVDADSLKITVNGTFGKTGSKWSILYAPDLMIQTTVTGQLSLLMLIEAMELNGITVVSANTDGIVIKCPRHLESLMNKIVKQWEKFTKFETEETRYMSVYSRDVNNYIAVKCKQDKETKKWLDVIDGTTKKKGAYMNPWDDPKEAYFRMHKNPTNTICISAVENLLTKNVPIHETIRACKDIRKFISLRNVQGGAVKNGVYLGKVIRWYYAANEGGEIIYASNGNKVPRSDGARPLMELPEEFPSDVNFEWYEAEAHEILKEIAYLKE